MIILSLPYVFFEMCLGFTFDFPLALALAISAKALGEIVAFYTGNIIYFKMNKARILLRRPFYNICKDNIYYKIL